MLKHQGQLRKLFALAVIAIASLSPANVLAAVSATQEQAGRRALTPLQLEIENQRQRLSSAAIEDRREALTRLRSLQHPAASRVALSALQDGSPIVRASAAAAVLSLPADECASNLISLLSDKDEFVRQQVAYALGQTGSRVAVAGLVEKLTDKKDSVRGAAAVALGQIRDASAVPSLAAVLNPQPALASSKKSKSKGEKNPFVLRAAAHSLGQIGNRAAVPTLILVLQDEKAEADVRREAALALGAIGDESAISILRSVLTASDPYLSQAAHEAIRKISRTQTRAGT